EKRAKLDLCIEGSYTVEQAALHGCLGDSAQRQGSRCRKLRGSLLLGKPFAFRSDDLVLQPGPTAQGQTLYRRSLILTLLGT
ncbi:hypothetical protein P7K49_034042, partial [Saguinus oedipus]